MYWKFLLVSGTISHVVQLVIVFHIGGNNKDVGGNPCKILKSYQGEYDVEKHRQEMGDTSGQGGFEGIWNADSGHIHWLKAGDIGSVGDSKSVYGIKTSK